MLRAFAGSALLGLLVVLPISPAFAHASLTSSTPQDGATLASPPAEVVFTFDDALLEDTETISINDIDGNVVASQQVTPQGASMSVPWPADIDAGTYQVAYRVVSADGHPVTGAITFTITGGAPPTPTAAPTAATAASAAGTSASPTAASASPTATSASPTATAGPSDAPPSGPPVLAIVAALAALAVGGTAVILALARRRST